MYEIPLHAKKHAKIPNILEMNFILYRLGELACVVIRDSENTTEKYHTWT